MFCSFLKNIFEASLESADRTFFISLLFLFGGCRRFFLSSLNVQRDMLCWGVLCHTALFYYKTTSGIDGPDAVRA